QSLMRKVSTHICDEQRIDTLRELYRTVLGDLLKAVIEKAIGEAHPNALPIAIDSERRESGHDLLRDHTVEKIRKLWIGDRFAHEAMTARDSQIGERGMAGIEHMKFQTFERRDVGNNLGAGGFPRGSRTGEAVLDHPLREGFAHDG